MTISPQFDYLDGQLRASHPALFERLAIASAAVDEGEFDIPYGPHPRQTFDLFRSATPARAAIVYFHGGYWQARDKADFRFIAPPLNAGGFDVALVNYPLCPEASVAAITASALAAMPVVAERAGDLPLILVGHSAGGQIVAEIAMAGVAVAGIVAISGVFDLAPLTATSLNERLGLDDASARAGSPVYRVGAGLPPALFAVGGDETMAFRAQTHAMCAAWAAAGNDAREMVVPGADHFSILERLCDRADPLGIALRGLVPVSRPARGSGAPPAP